MFTVKRFSQVCEKVSASLMSFELPLFDRPVTEHEGWLERGCLWLVVIEDRINGTKVPLKHGQPTAVITIIPPFCSKAEYSYKPRNIR